MTNPVISTAFNLPNFQGRYLKQGTVGTYSSSFIPHQSN